MSERADCGTQGPTCALAMAILALLAALGCRRGDATAAYGEDAGRSVLCDAATEGGASIPPTKSMVSEEELTDGGAPAEKPCVVDVWSGGFEAGDGAAVMRSADLRRLRKLSRVRRSVARSVRDGHLVVRFTSDGPTERIIWLRLRECTEKAALVILDGNFRVVCEEVARDLRGCFDAAAASWAGSAYRTSGGKLVDVYPAAVAVDSTTKRVLPTVVNVSFGGEEEGKGSVPVVLEFPSDGMVLRGRPDEVLLERAGERDGRPWFREVSLETAERVFIEGVSDPDINGNASWFRVP
jgi:hypothetical protein